MMENAAGESSIDQYIEKYRDLSISYDKLHLYEKMTFFPDRYETTDGIIIDECYLQKYKNDLEELIIEKTFTRDEKFKYTCNPWALSYDLYGTTEFWFLLLDLNNMYSATEFTKTTILVYDASLPTVVDSIMALEEETLNQNRADVDELDLSDINDNDDDDSIGYDE